MSGWRLNPAFAPNYPIANTRILLQGAQYIAPLQEISHIPNHVNISSALPTDKETRRTVRARLSKLAPLDGVRQLGHHRPMETRCAHCGAAMTCQPEGGCWCAELPKVPMPPDATGCLCRDCLLGKIEALKNTGDRKKA